MRIDIRTAALDDDVERRVRLAANLLAAYRLQARVSAWDGTRCHLLVAAADDQYGRQAIALASRRGTPVVALASDATTEVAGNVTTLSMFSPAPALARVITGYLSDTRTAIAETPLAPVAEVGVCRLSSPPLRGHAVDVSAHGRMAQLRPEVGRAYALSHSDLLAAADALAGTTAVLDPVVRPTAVDGQAVSTSLEGLLVRAALRACERLPPFPSGTYSLEGWPDLGMLPEAVGALTLSKKLLRAPSALEDLMQDPAIGLEPLEIQACLWAFSAADLLKRNEATPRPAIAPAPPPEPERAGLWRSLARRFGLSGRAA